VRRRLLLSYVSLVVFVLLALELPLGLSFANAERRRLTSDAQHDAFAIAVRTDLELTPGSIRGSTALRAMLSKFAARTHDEITILDSGGHVVAATAGGPALGADLSANPAVQVALRGDDATREIEASGDDILNVAVPLIAGRDVGGIVLVGVDLSGLSHRITSNWLRLLVLGGIVLAVVLLVSLLLAQSFTRPLHELQRAAKRLGDGDLGARVKVPEDPAELRELAESFNATAEHLATLLRSQQSFIADASHQLRTPLTALQFRLENLEDDAPEHRDDVGGARREVVRLSQLVDGLLKLARAEQAAPPRTDVDLRAVAEDRCAAWWPLAADHQVTLETDVPIVAVRSSPGRLEQVLDNLLDNAIEAAPAGSVVRVIGRKEGGRAVVEVHDGGPGMSAEQRARAFDRFWRGSQRRSEGAGFGLGLAIVRQLVLADGGDVELADSPQGGLCVRVRLLTGAGSAASPAAEPLVPASV